MDEMQFPRVFFLAAPMACLLAQTPPQTKTVPLPIPGAQGKTPTVTLSPEEPKLPNLPPNAVVMTIGDEKVTAGEFDSFVNVLPEQYRAAARGPARKQFAENIAKVKVFAAEARRRKMDQSLAYSFQTENVLAGLLFQDLLAHTKVNDAELHTYYDQHKAEYEQVQAKHILVRMKGSPVPVKPEGKDLTPEEALAKAQEIRKKLLAGGDFNAIAKTESDDSGSGSKGGELGTFHHGQMVPSFEQAAFSLPVGQLSEPVKTQFGYHLIMVEKHDTRNFEQVRPELEKKLAPEMAQKAMDELRKNVPVTYDPNFFGGPNATPAAPPAVSR